MRAKLGSQVRAVVDDERSQHRNRQIAMARLRDRIAAAGKVERVRRATKLTKGSERRRLDEKKRRGERKRQRRSPGFDE
ncbi:MAG: hypothetical protein R2695_15705 [Acidimicrobiales bacterium]